MGRTVSQIKNRFYQSLKGKDLKNGKDNSEELSKIKTDSANKRQGKTEEKAATTSLAKNSFDDSEPHNLRKISKESPVISFKSTTVGLSSQRMYS